MFSTQPFPAVAPLRKGISCTDVQALGLILMILIVVDLPIFHSVGPGKDKRTSNPIVAAAPAPIRTASAQTAFPDTFKPDVSSLATRAGASVRGLPH